MRLVYCLKATNIACQGCETTLTDMAARSATITTQHTLLIDLHRLGNEKFKS